MDKKKLISLNEDDLLKVEQIVLDRDKEEALDFVKQVIKKQIDRDNASKMKREGI
jgi:transcription initiation factor IIF auxiliary subunit